MRLETQNYGRRPAKRVRPVERCKRHGSQRKMDRKYWAAWAAQKSLDEEKERGKKMK